MTNGDSKQIPVKVHWPEDTYADASPANLFIFTDNGEDVCFAFGFMAPPPNVAELAAEHGELNYLVSRKTSFVIPRSMILNLQRELTGFISRNPHLFGVKVEEGGHADASNDNG